ncbi:MAG: hypothetical protein QCI38_03030 [Candidatus Thermoplasmatota archaeon]|nr:hypothetical protein [Candidatus Thermoplasmatota archaeon]
MNAKTLLKIFLGAKIAATAVVAILLVAGIASIGLFFSGGDGQSEGEGPPFITLPEGGDFLTGLRGDVITFSAPMKVNNHGFLPVEDFSIDIFMEYDGQTIFQGFNSFGDVPGGASVPREVKYSADISDLIDQGLAEVLYKDLTTKITISVSAKYLFGWIDFKLKMPFEMDWQAPVNISIDSGRMSFPREMPDGNYSVSIPLRINTAPWLSGRIESNISVTIPQISSIPLGFTPLDVPLGGDGGTHYVNFTVSPTQLASLSSPGLTMILGGNVQMTLGSGAEATQVNYEMYNEIPYPGGM